MLLCLVSSAFVLSTSTRRVQYVLVVSSTPATTTKMSSDPDSFLRGQTDLHGRIARAFDNLRKLDVANITLGAVESRLCQLDSNWRKFEKGDEYIRGHCWSKIEKHDYIVNDFVGTVEETYLQVRTQFVNYLQQMKTDAARDASLVIASEQSSSKMTMPKIQLSVFSGNFEEWPAYYDLFKNMVIDNEFLSVVQQMHFLKTTVTGEAEQLIRCFTSTGDNFDRAWTALTSY